MSEISSLNNILSYLNHDGFRENYSLCTIFNTRATALKTDDPTELFHCHLFVVLRGLPGGFLGVTRDGPLVTPRKPSIKSHGFPLIYQRSVS